MLRAAFQGLRHRMLLERASQKILHRRLNAGVNQLQAYLQAVRRVRINSPGKWDAMISYTQRHAQSETLADALHSAFTQRGLTVWLDVKMTKLNEGAMEEAVKNSGCVVAIDHQRW